MKATTIRAGRVEDAPALIGIEARAAQRLRGHEAHALFCAHALSPDQLVRAAAAGRLRVAELDGGAVGFALYDVLDEDAHLLEMDVDPAHGRGGIGRALLEASCEAARAEGFSSMVLTTLSDVPWNAPFYASAGFVEWPASKWGGGMRGVIERERRLGFPMHLRVAMRRGLR